MITEDGETITHTDPHRHKFDDAITEYAYLRMLSGMFGYGSGDAECPLGWFAPIDRKRIIRGDDRGFVWTEKFATEAIRDAVHTALEDAYSAWSDDEYDDTEEGEEAHQLEVATAMQYVAYAYDCDRQNIEPKSRHDWMRET